MILITALRSCIFFVQSVHRCLKTVACPVIEEVNDKTLQYKFVTRDLVGVFHWNLDFDWREVEREDWRPYESPVMAGGLFTMRSVGNVRGALSLKAFKDNEHFSSCMS